ncbi:MAG: PAS domain S-box protein [Cyanobacteria bacterium J007]|jgi:diguanylate cyclase (GGDEF)-like protein/PAS domain S-box-containing protein|nr:MAG: PAS domain S-box protein [Cyanobacteria bacterium J007]
MNRNNPFFNHNPSRKGDVRELSPQENRAPHEPTGSTCECATRWQAHPSSHCPVSCSRLRLLEGILSSLDEAIWSVSVSRGETFYVSPAAERIYGRAIADFFNDPHLWFDTIHPDDRPRVERVLARVTSERGWDLQYRIVRPDGEIRWLHERASLIRDPLTRADRLDGIAADITDRHPPASTPGSDRPPSREQLYREALRHFPNGAIVIFDENLRYIVAEGRGLVEVGLLSEVLEGQTIDQVFPPSIVADIEPQYRAVFNGVDSLNQIVYGDRVYQVYTVPLLDKSGAVFAGMAVTQDITHNQQIQEALRESEERWQLVLEANNDGIWDWNIKTGEVFFSARWKEQLGYADAEIANQLQEWHDRIHPDDRESVLAAIADHFQRDSEFYVAQYRLRAKNGDYKWILDRGKARWDEDGNPKRMSGSHADISERQAIEQALRESQQKYKSLFEAFPIGISITDGNGSLLEANPASERILGLSLDEHTSRRYDEESWAIVRSDGTPMPAEEFASVRALKENRTVENVEMGIVKGDGQITWISVTAAPIPLADYGVTIGYIDITERKETEFALRESEERFRSLVDSMNDIVFTLDLQGRHTGIFGCGYEQYQVDPRYFIGKTARDLFGPEAARVHETANRQALAGEQVIYEWSAPSPNGNLQYFQTLLSPLRDPGGAPIGLVGVGRDISDRKRAEEEKSRLIASLRASEAKLAQAQRVAHLGSWEFEIDTQAFSWSQQCYSIFGVSEDTVLDYEAHLAQIHPEDRPLWQGTIARALEDGCCYQFIYRVYGADGCLRYVETRGEGIFASQERNPDRAEDGEEVCDRVVRLFGTVMDVTERQKAQIALQESEAKYRALMNEAVDAILLSDAQGYILEANKKAEQLLGYSQQELRGMHSRQLYPRQERSRILSSLHQTARYGKSEVLNTQVLCRDGYTIWVDLASSVVEWGRDRRVEQSILRDITFRIETERMLRQQAQRERLMGSIAQQIRQSLELSEILNAAVVRVRQFLRGDRVAIFRFESDWSGKIVAESVAEGWTSLMGLQIEDPCFQEKYVPLYRGGRIHRVEDVERSPLPPCYLQLLARFEARACLVVPIAQGERLWGLLVAHQCRSPRPWPESEVNFLSQLASQVGIATQQSQLYEDLKVANGELQRLATLDGLTQLANRRRFDEYLEQEWRRLAREREPLSLIMADIDFFKSYNDTYGHQAGDECLKQVARTIAATVKRPADVVARYGGEEFAVILPKTNLQGAEWLARRICDRVRGLQLPHSGSAIESWVTLSLGTATCIPTADGSANLLVAHADRALYEAKLRGRNRCYALLSHCTR